MKDIEQFLIGKGFRKNENSYTLIQERVVGQMVINGVAKNQTERVELEFVCIGDCEEEIDGQWVKNRSQWQFCVNGEPQTEVLVKNLSEFNEFFNI